LFLFFVCCGGLIGEVGSDAKSMKSLSFVIPAVSIFINFFLASFFSCYITSFVLTSSSSLWGLFGTGIRNKSTEPESAEVIAQTESAPNSPPASEIAQQTKRLEIQDARVIFNSTWNKLLQKYPEESMRFPSEIIFLMGAPGAGKGTNTPFILRARDITTEPIVTSSLFNEPEYKKIIDSGQMITDSTVLEILIEKLLKSSPNGALVDGFPRTKIQVECTIMLFDKLMELRKKFFETPLKEYYRRPKFRISVLFVDKEESVRRQLARGKRAREHNEMIRKRGQNNFVEERNTDFDIELIQKRYEIFREHYNDMLRLKDRFLFHLIDASQPIEQVSRVILREFDYQSSNELDEETFDSIHLIPLASEIGLHAKQQLVRRLDTYQMFQKPLFAEAIDFINRDIIPVVKRHSIAGRATLRSENLQCTNPLFIDIVLDILSERGYHVIFDYKDTDTPDSVNSKTWKIYFIRKRVFFFHLQFPRHTLRH